MKFMFYFSLLPKIQEGRGFLKSPPPPPRGKEFITRYCTVEY